MPTKRSASLRVDPATEAHRVAQRLAAVVETRLDRREEDRGEVAEALAEVASRDVDAERQRQSGLEQPPLAEVEHLVQPFALVRELALVDHEAGVGAARGDLVEDAVERQLAVPDLAEREAERQEGGRRQSGHDDLVLAELLQGQRLARDDDRAVAVADAGAVRQQGVAVLHERIRVQRDRGHLELALQRPLVQRLDVLQHLLELESAGVDRAGRDRPEHERVVWIGTVAEPDEHRARLAARRPRHTLDPWPRLRSATQSRIT